MPKKVITKMSKEELQEFRKNHKPSQRRLKASSRAFTFAKNMKMLSGKSSNLLDSTARSIAEAVGGINSLTDELSVPDENGVYPALTEEKLRELNESYSKALKECDNMISGNGLNEKTKNSQKYKSYVEMAKLTRKFLMSDFKYLETANAGLGGSLSEIITNARSIVLKADMVKFDKLGAAQSSRFPMTVQLPGGKKVKGLFTKKDDFDPVAEYNAIFDELKVDPALEKFMDSLKISPDYDKFDTLVSRYDSTLSELGREKSKKIQPDVVTLLGFITGKNSDYLENKNGYAEAESILKKKEIAEKIAGVLASKGKVRLARLGVNYKGGGIRNGNLDTKSAACSVVAALLGRSDLLANSAPVKMQKDGEMLEGTFMEFVDGIDLTRIGSDKKDPENEPFYSLRFYNGVDKRPVLKDIFDLEIMDYIFGNIDCHGGNILYDIRKEGQNGPYFLNGIKRIDLDNTFIEKDVNEIGIHNMTSVKNMKVISESMAKRLTGLTGDTLKLALRNYMKRIAAANTAANFIEKYENRIEIKREEPEKKKNGPVL